MFPDMTQLLCEQPTWLVQNNLRLSKEKKQLGSKRLRPGCSKCRWRGRNQELTSGNSKYHPDSTRGIPEDIHQTIKALTPETILWTSVWIPDYRWWVVPHDIPGHHNKDPQPLNISSQTMIPTLQCALPVLKLVLSHQDLACLMEDLLLPHEGILLSSLHLPGRVPLSLPPCSLSRRLQEKLEVDSRLLFPTNNSEQLYRWSCLQGTQGTTWRTS